MKRGCEGRMGLGAKDYLSLHSRESRLPEELPGSSESLGFHLIGVADRCFTFLLAHSNKEEPEGGDKGSNVGGACPPSGLPQTRSSKTTWVWSGATWIHARDLLCHNGYDACSRASLNLVSFFIPNLQACVSPFWELVGEENPLQGEFLTKKVKRQTRITMGCTMITVSYLIFGN